MQVVTIQGREGKKEGIMYLLKKNKSLVLGFSIIVQSKVEIYFFISLLCKSGVDN